MIIAGTLMLPDARRGVRLAQGWLRVEDDRIAEVHPGQPRTTPDLGDPETLVLPGFVDAHMHLPQFDHVGAAGLGLLDWLEKVIYPAEAAWADADLAGQVTLRVLDALAGVGTVGIGAYATVHHPGTRAAIEACRSRGVRALVGQVLMDQQAPDELIRPHRQLLRESQALLEQYPPSTGGNGHSRVSAAVTPRFAITCSSILLRRAGALAETSGAYVQTHLAEDLTECRRAAELHGGPGYLEIYEMTRLNGPRTLYGHGVWLSEADHACLADADAVIAHCPTANEFLGTGAMDLAQVRAADVRVALGSDLAGGPDRSMVRVARSMIETARRLGKTPPTPARCWQQITAGNADCLGFDRLGRLAAGADASLLLVRPDLPLDGPADPLAKMLYAWDDRWIQRTLIAGRSAYVLQGASAEADYIGQSPAENTSAPTSPPTRQGQSS
jgi:guanine deaminase